MKLFGVRIGVPEGQFNSVLFGGLLGSLFSFLQFVASPMIGGLSDHFGRRPLLLLSTAGVAFSYALWVNASTFGLFVLARIIGGLSKGNVSLATAIITDVSTPKTRQKGMALIGIAFSIGFLVGPMVGAGTFPQCGNFENLLPCRFYVKSILAKFRRSKNDILTILLALNFDFT